MGLKFFSYAIALIPAADRRYAQMVAPTNHRSLPRNYSVIHFWWVTHCGLYGLLQRNTELSLHCSPATINPPALQPLPSFPHKPLTASRCCVRSAFTTIFHLGKNSARIRYICVCVCARTCIKTNHKGFKLKILHPMGNA